MDKGDGQESAESTVDPTAAGEIKIPKNLSMPVMFDFMLVDSQVQPLTLNLNP